MSAASGGGPRTDRDQFRAFAEIYTLGTSPLYEALSGIVLRHDDILALVRDRRPGQPAPNMLFAAVKLLVGMTGPGTELIRYYSDLGGDLPADDPNLEAVFVDFCRRHAPVLRGIIEERVTNTNEVRRSACLMPAFAEAGRLFGNAPFSLIEIGSSAGFNLNWDRYAYRYRAGDGTVIAAGDLEPGGLLLECELRGEHRPGPWADWPPIIADRCGIERDWVDLGDGEDRAWLHALVWPEHVERIKRLGRALDIAAVHPPPVFDSDALSLLPVLLSGLPSGLPVCVFHSFVLYQFSGDERARLAGILREGAKNRPLARISYESMRDRPEALLMMEDVNRQTRRKLAFCDSHGSWLEWLPDTGTP